MRQISEDLRSELKTICGVAQEVQTIPLDQINFDAPELINFFKKIDFLDEYQLNGLSLMCSSTQEKARWFATLDRNLLGYMITPLISIAALIALLSINSTAVPVILFSTFCSTIAPITLSSAVILALAIALRHAIANNDKKIDNKYKLDYSNSKNPDELYFNAKQSQEAIALGQTYRELDSGISSRW